MGYSLRVLNMAAYTEAALKRKLEDAWRELARFRKANNELLREVAYLRGALQSVESQQ